MRTCNPSRSRSRFSATRAPDRAIPNAALYVGFECQESAAILHCPRVVVIPLCRWIQRCASDRGQRQWLKLLMAFEWLGRTPLRYLTGHFIALRAVARP